FDEQKLINEITQTTLIKLFPKESLNFQWKQLRAMDHLSKFETTAGLLHGFNGPLVVQIKYQRLKVKDTEIVIGYLAELVRGPQAKETFDITLAADTEGTIAACNASVGMISSITGEKFDGDHDPCSLDVTTTTPPTSR